MRLIGYCRVSTSQQEDEGSSLEAQRERIEGWAKSNYTVDGKPYELIDLVLEQASAKTRKREKLEDVRRRCLAGEAEGMIIVKLDRLTRNVDDIRYFIKNDFSKYTLISLQDHLDTNSATGRMMLNFIVMISEWERETIAERTKATLDFKKSKGEKMGGQAPYGYKEKEENKNGRIVKVLDVDQTELKMVALILDMWDSEKYSLNKITKVLFEKGYVNRNGKKFHPQQIKRIINYQRNLTTPEESTYYVYKITCIKKGHFNGHEYIGVHKHNYPERNEYMGGGTILQWFHKAMGMDSFKKEIIQLCETKKQAYDLEKKFVTKDYIARSDTFNAQAGGMGWGKHIEYVHTWKDDMKKYIDRPLHSKIKAMSINEYLEWDTRYAERVRSELAKFEI